MMDDLIPPPAPPASPDFHSSVSSFARSHNAVQKELQFLLVGAIENRDVNKIKELINKGVDPNCVIVYARRPLTYALQLEAFHVAEVLIANGADVNGAEKPVAGGYRPLHKAILGSLTLSLVKLLLSHGSDVNGRDSFGRTPLHLACCKGDILTVHVLISFNADINAVDVNGRTALHCAFLHHHLDIASRLLDKGALIGIKDKHGWTVLSYCVARGDVSGVQFILSCADGVKLVNEMDKKRQNPILLAVRALERDNLEILLTYVEAPKRTQTTWEIRESVAHNISTLVELLIDMGASVRQLKLSSLQAARHISVSLICLLVLCGLKLDVTDLDLPIFDVSTGRLGSHRAWFEEQLTTQWGLQRICRNVIRCHLASVRKGIKEHVSQLPLPVKLQEYLNFADLNET